MWQRQIQLRLLSAAPRLSPIGCGSWTMIVSHSPCSPSALISLISSKISHCSVAQRLLGALERVVEELGRVEELLFAEDHVPVGVDADVPHQRHDRVEDLRDAAAEGGGADVQDAVSLHRLGQLADALDRLLAGDVGVVGEGLLAEGDFLKHQGVLHRPAVTQPLAPRALAQGDLDRFPLAVAKHDQRHLVPGLVGRDEAGEVGWVALPRGLRPRGSRRRPCGSRRPGSAACRRRPRGQLRRLGCRARLQPAGRRGRRRARASRASCG